MKTPTGQIDFIKYHYSHSLEHCALFVRVCFNAKPSELEHGARVAWRDGYPISGPMEELGKYARGVNTPPVGD